MALGSETINLFVLAGLKLLLLSLLRKWSSVSWIFVLTPSGPPVAHVGVLGVRLDDIDAGVLGVFILRNHTGIGFEHRVL